MLGVTNTIVAGSTIFFSAAPQSPSGQPASPLQAFVKVICITTNTVIREETQVSVTGDQVNFSVTGTENEMVDITNTKEKRRALLRVEFGIDDDFTDYAEYTVTRADLDPTLAV